MVLDPSVMRRVRSIPLSALLVLGAARISHAQTSGVVNVTVRVVPMRSSEATLAAARTISFRSRSRTERRDVTDATVIATAAGAPLRPDAWATPARITIIHW